MIFIIIAAIGVATLAHSAPFPFLFEAFRPSRSVWRIKPAEGQQPTLYLTFDDGPNAEWTPAVLAALNETGVLATFFLIDEHVTPETAPLVRRMADEGHAIALHSGTRKLMMIGPDALAETLRRAADRIATITGNPPCPLFRPHAGWRSETMYRGLDRAGYRLAGWSWGMWDWDWWRAPRGDRVAARIVRKASPGDIVVIHDGHHKNPLADRRHAAGALRLLVPELRAKGFTFAPLCSAGRSADGPPR